MTVKIKILFLFFFIFFWQLLPAQDTYKISGKSGENYVGDDSIQSGQYQLIQSFYDSLMCKSNEILNGKEYEYYFYPQISSPLIPIKPYPDASIVINGKKYENITLQYDTFKDLVVYFDPTNLVHGLICPIIVNKYIIDEFEIGVPKYIIDESEIKVSSEKLRFVYLKIPEGERLKSGFYEIVYEGESQFVIKHLSNKYIDEGRDKYKYSTIRYVMNKAGYFKIKGKRSLLKALPYHNKEIKKYIKLLNISVRNANKYEILNILRYYDSIQLP